MSVPSLANSSRLTNISLERVGLASASDLLYVMAYDTRSQIYGRCIASANSPTQVAQKGIQGYLDLGQMLAALLFKSKITRMHASMHKLETRFFKHAFLTCTHTHVSGNRYRPEQIDSGTPVVCIVHGITYFQSLHLCDFVHLVHAHLTTSKLCSCLSVSMYHTKVWLWLSLPRRLTRII